MDSNTEKLVRKTLAYLIKCDMTRAAISSIGASNNVSKTSLAAMVYDCVTADKKGADTNERRRSR